MNKNILNVFSTDPDEINRFFKQLDSTITIKQFDVSLVEKKDKLKELIDRAGTEDDMVFHFDSPKNQIELCGFIEKCEIYYNKLVELIN